MISGDKDDLLTLVSRAFYVGDEIDKQPDIFARKDLIRQGYEKKERYGVNWEGFIESLKKENMGRVRDMSLAGDLHSYVGFVSFDDYSIIFSVSFPFRLYGFYYQEWHQDTDTGKYWTVESYSSFGGVCSLNSQRVEDLLNKYFEGFSRLDPAIAGEKVEKIRIDAQVHKNIDLWHVLLSTYDSGGI